ncbi:trypsin-like peptidase domain-containing protein [Streptomyces sp. NPDC088812]|uniref:trypsin-like peptidase domain-containing protein n=1 Tax=Streptomyces sp. NPDC088812 TaxID=3365905 RepID=UPI0037FE82EF
MAGVPWSDRLVEVIADLGPGGGYRYGSGCVVVGKTVLTAAHVVAGAVGVTVRDDRKRSYAATVDPEFVGDPDGPGPDLALLRADGLPGEGYPPLPLGRVVRDGSTPVAVDHCHAFGHPGFAESPVPVPARDSVQVIGCIAPLSKLTRGLLSMVVSMEPAAPGSGRVQAGESPWAGMSGGPVVAEECLLGVVVEHAPAEGTSAITVVPLTALEADPDRPRWGPGVADPGAWWRRFAVEGPADLRPVPTPQPGSGHAQESRSAYTAQVERIAPAELLGRARELEELAQFCTEPDGGPYLRLRAPAWAGKSALLSWFVLHPPPGIRVVSFFVTARLAGQDDRVAFSDAVLEQVLALLGQPAPVLLTESTRDAHTLAKLDEAAALCGARGERLVLVVDGLDEDRGADGHSIAALLPQRPAAALRVVVAGRLNPPLPPDVREDHPLHDPATWRTLGSSPHAALTRTAMRRELKHLLADPSDRHLLGLVSAAGGGLGAADLAELTGRKVWQVEDRLSATAGRTFTTRAGIWQERQTYVLGHEDLQQEALDLLGPDELNTYRRSLHAWADTYDDRGWPGDTPDFLLLGYFRLLQATGSVTRMAALATDPARQALMLARSGAETAAMAELVATQDALLEGHPPDLTAMATIGVHQDVMARRNRNISPELPPLWAKLGDHTRAEALARSITDEDLRAAALRGITEATAPEGRPEEAPAAKPAGEPAGQNGSASGGAQQAAAGFDSIIARDVEELLSAARSLGADDAADLFHAAETTAYQAGHPDLRADLWNDILQARGAAGAAPASPERCDTALVSPDRPDLLLDEVVQRALAVDDPDRALAVARVIHRRDHRFGPLADVVEYLVRAGAPEAAEELALSSPGGEGGVALLNRLVGTAVEAGLLEEVERIARERLAPHATHLATALARTARHLVDGGVAERGRQLFAEALELLGEPSAREQENVFLDVVQSMAETGAFEEAASAASSLHSDDLRPRALLSLAHLAHDQGESAHATTLAAQVLRDEAARRPPFWGPDPLSDAVALTARLGHVDDAVAAVPPLAGPDRRTDLLVRIVEAALESGHLDAAHATAELITSPPARHGLAPAFIRAHLRAGDHAAATAVARGLPAEEVSPDLITTAALQALDDGGLDVADLLAGLAPQHDIQVTLRISVARAAVTSAAPARARELLEAAESAARAVPDPVWQADALTAAAWALLPHSDTGRIGMLMVAAETAARRIPDPTTRADALTDIAAVVTATGDRDRTDRIFEELAHTAAIPCAWAERLAARARAAADRARHDTARARTRAVGGLVPWIDEPHNRIRAAQAWLAAAIHVGDLDQADEAARAVDHPDQRALALTDVARACAAAGETERAIEVALTVDAPDRRADALTEVARLAAARGELDAAERAALGITVRGGRPPALLGVAWEASRGGDLARAERIVAAITDPARRRLGLDALHAQHHAPRTHHAPSASPAEPRGRPEPAVEDPLVRVESSPDDPAAVRLLAEALRRGPCVPAFAALGRIDPPAAAAVADTLLGLLG